MTDEIKEEVVENEYDAKKDAEDNKGITVLAYIGLLFLIPLFVRKESKFARFHCNQGLVLLIAGAAASIATGILATILGFIRLGWLGTILSTAVYLCWVAMIVIGIINVVKGETKELPVIGKFRILK